MNRLFLGTLLISACGRFGAETSVGSVGSGTVGPDETGVTWEGGTLLQTVSDECLSPTRWRYAVRTIGWASDPRLTVTDGVDIEEHTLRAWNAAPDGSWSELERELVATDGEPESDASTGYFCNDDERAALTWRVRVRDPDGVEADCAVWGADPDLLELDGCRILAQ